MKLPVFWENLIKELGDKTKPLSGRDKWLLLFLFGLLLAVIVFPMDKKEEKEERQGAQQVQAASGVEQKMSVSQYEAYLSAQLKRILEEMDGAGQVEAWVTLECGEEQVLYQEKNSKSSVLEEADSVGGTRTQEEREVEQTTLLDGEGEPYIIKTMQPKIEGVLVLSEGAEDREIKKNIMEAVQVLFGIDVHRIKVAKKRVEE